MRCFDSRNEMMPREELEQFQLERLQSLVTRIRRNVRQAKTRISDKQIESLAELSEISPLTPDELVENAPYGMFALPLREVIRLQSAIGPNGSQLVIGHTRNDLINWGRLVARQLVAAGVTAHDVIQICFVDGTFEKALGCLLGAELIEASVIPQEPFHIDLQLAMMQNYRATVLITTPSNAIDLASLLKEKGIEPQALQLKSIILSRLVTPDEKQEIESGLMADVYSLFGIGEVLDPGICVQCEEGCRHINEDQFIAEIQDGELLITTLCREAIPLLRYRTGISAEIRRVECPCGRTGAMLVPGERLDNRLLINETPVYEVQIRDILAATIGKEHPFQLEITGRKLVIHLEITRSFFSDKMRELSGVKEHLQSELLNRLGIESEIIYVNPAQ